MNRTSEACYVSGGSSTVVVTGEEDSSVNLLVLDGRTGRGVEVVLEQDELAELIDALEAVQE